MSILNFSFFKTAKPRKFEPLPRFYDPQKEYIDSLKKRAENKDDIDALKVRLKQNFGKNRFSNTRMTDNRIKRANRMSNIRLVILIAVLLALSYYFLMS